MTVAPGARPRGLQMNAPADTPPNQGLEHGFLLGYLRIDPAEGVVTGPGGREKLDPKVMDVLVLMARNAGHVVLREDLLAQLWPNAVVTDDALTRCFYELRRQLSLAGGDDRYKAMLETLPKRGYRLNAEIRPLQEPLGAQPSSSPKRRLLAIGIAIAAVIALAIVIVQRFAGPQSPPSSANSIAVLPFVDMSAGKDQQYFSDGISEEIRDRLDKIRQLRVIARTSSFSFRDESVGIPEIAAKLDVTHVLEGSVRRSGNSLRITAQLIEASSNSSVWSETYDREAGDLLAIQDEIATAVAAALSVTLGGAELHGSVPASPDAYELFLQGRVLLRPSRTRRHSARGKVLPGGARHRPELRQGHGPHLRAPIHCWHSTAMSRRRPGWRNRE